MCRTMDCPLISLLWYIAWITAHVYGSFISFREIDKIERPTALYGGNSP